MNVSGFILLVPTGNPKGTVHVHKAFFLQMNSIRKNVLNIKSNDIIFSAAKLFCIWIRKCFDISLMCRSNNSAFKVRPTPDLVFSIFEKYNPTLFFGVPTLYSAMLNSEKIPSQISPRLCISAGEALRLMWNQWEKKFNIKILDGIGSTEMLHIFLF